ncbi:MAG: phosphoribosylanthranilate isomerase [Actinomycetota bacterium]|jgi:phosphoribosylanthranilate isomerase
MRLNFDRFFVKICGVTSEEDALMCIGFGASAIGFVFAPSVRQVAPSLVHDIVRRLPRDVLTVGVFKNESGPRVAEIANSIGLGAVQLHGSESLATVKYVADRVRTVIRALPYSSPLLQPVDAAGLDYLLLDGATPGSGETHDWSIFAEQEFTTPVIAAGGLTPGNVFSTVFNHPVMGVDVSSGVELAPGVKDPVRVFEFISYARSADEARREGTSLPFDWSDQ